MISNMRDQFETMVSSLEGEDACLLASACYVVSYHTAVKLKKNDSSDEEQDETENVEGKLPKHAYFYGFPWAVATDQLITIL
jgi:hypothetical protein